MHLIIAIVVRCMLYNIIQHTFSTDLGSNQTTVHDNLKTCEQANTKRLTLSVMFIYSLSSAFNGLCKMIVLSLRVLRCGIS